MVRVWRHRLSFAAGLLITALGLGLEGAAAQDGSAKEGGKALQRRAAAALEAAYGYVKDKAAGQPGKVLLAAQGTAQGHWRFVNPAGEMFTAGTADEMKRVVAVLYPAAKPGAPVMVYLTEDTVLGPGNRLGALPVEAEMHIVVAGKSYGLLPLRGEPRYVALRSLVAIELQQQPQALKEALLRLDRPLAEAGVRLVSLVPGIGPRAPLPTGGEAVAAAPVERIDPAHLAEALPGLDGQVLVVCAPGAGDLVFAQPAKAGAPGRGLPVPVDALMTAAEEGVVGKASVALIVLQFASTFQRPPDAPCPDGGRKGNELTLGDILEAAAQEGRRSPVAVTLAGHLKALDATVIGDLVSGTIRLKGARRWAAGDSIGSVLPLPLPVLYMGLLLLGWLGTPVARRLWTGSGNGLWKVGDPKDYSSRTGYWAAQTVGFLVFALVFQPLTSVYTAFYNLLPQVWEAITVLVRPFVWLWRAWDWFARLGAGSK